MEWWIVEQCNTRNSPWDGPANPTSLEPRQQGHSPKPDYAKHLHFDSNFSVKYYTQVDLMFDISSILYICMSTF